MDLTRRAFLGGVLAIPAVRSWLEPFSFLAPLGASAGADPDGRVLLVVQLSGGNDGLNTVVPVDDDLYHRARPTLRLAKGSGVALSSELMLHPSLGALRDLHGRGELAVVTNVGYPKPDRSHFRSMDIWHTASTAEPGATSSPTGWIGRVADSVGLRSGDAAAIHVGATEQPLSLVGERMVVPSILDVENATVEPLRLDASTGSDGSLLRRLAEVPRGDALAAAIAASARTAYDASDRLRSVADSYRPGAVYPASALARKLSTVAQVLEAGFATRIVAVETDGYDTHANQEQAHEALLAELGGALAAFHADLRAHGRGDRVLTVVFSEFGRRVKENASSGTDHGAAGPVLLLGGGVRGGVHGAPPDLAHLDDGDVVMDTDFRRVYATALDVWLGLPSEPILGGRFATLGVLRD